MKWWDWIMVALIALGAINWGLYGIWDYNLVPVVTFGSVLAAKIVYGAIGLLGVGLLVSLIIQAVK